MSSNDDAIQFLAPWSGPKPPVHGFNPSIGAEEMFLIGYIITQWGYLSSTIDFRISFWRMHPNVPDDVRARRAGLFKTKIALLRELSKYVLQDARKDAFELHNSNLDSIMRLRVIRDNLAHGTFDLASNKEPGKITVNTRGGKVTYKQPLLLRAAADIGKSNSFFHDFDSWVHYELNVSLFRKLGGPEPQG